MKRLIVLLAAACLAAAPATRPSTRPTTLRTKDFAKLVAGAEAKVAQAKAVAAAARAVAVKGWQAGAGKAMLADLAAKQKALDEARRTGSPQLKLEASAAFTKAKATVDAALAVAPERDAAVVAAERSLNQARNDLRSAEADAREADAAIKLAAKEQEERERAAKLARYRESMAPAGRDAKPLRALRLMGDETVCSDVLAKPHTFVGKPFILVGAVAVDNYYNFEWERAEPTHFSISFREVDAKLNEGEIGHLYLRRDIGDDLIDALSAARKVNARAHRVGRFRATIPRERWRGEGRGGVMCELIDWQFLMPDGDTWGPWASEVKSLKEEDPPVPAIKVPVRGLERGMTLKEVEAVKGTKGQLQETRPNGLRVYRFYVPGSPINLIVSSSTERLDGIGE